MVKARLITLFLLFFLTFFGQKKKTNHAIVIGLDHYANGTIWSSQEQLKGNIDTVLRYFTSENIYHFKTDSLRNENVTLSNIDALFKFLTVDSGDNVMIYFIGHGTQIVDTNDDEKDGWDEAFACFNSPSSQDRDFSKKGLTDDHLQDLLTHLRKRLGSSGQVFMMVESCHSGTMDKDGQHLKFAAYSKTWQTAFMSEANSKNKEQNMAPLISFSSSRAYVMTNIGYNFTTFFLSVFQNFKAGSYYDLYKEFYFVQRDNVFQNADIQLAVNLNVDDPYYLRFGVLRDTVYAEKSFSGIIDIDQRYAQTFQCTIDIGLFQGVTVGTIIGFTDTSGNKFSGKVILTRSASAVVQLEKPTAPSKPELWKCDVSVSNYNFTDTLLINIDTKMPLPWQKATKAAVNGLGFIKIIATIESEGYTLVYFEDRGAVLRRNKDNIGLYLIVDSSLSSIRSALLKIQISHFIIGLQTAMDTTITLIMKSGDTIARSDVVKSTAGQKWSLFVKPVNLTASRYYCILQIEDEIIKQLVPVNFQINESECRLSISDNRDVFIGDLVMGNLDGKIVLISSSNPIDLREILLTPLEAKRGNGKMDQIRLLIDRLFLKKDGSPPLYNANDIMTTFQYYKVYQ